jgi:hypothetical protein
MKPAPSKTELSPSTQLRKVVFGGSLILIVGICTGVLLCGWLISRKDSTNLVNTDDPYRGVRLERSEISNTVQRAQNGSVQDAIKLADHYIFAQHDITNGIEYLKLAVNFGSSVAAFNLGQLYACEPSIIDLKKSRYWYSIAAERGDTNASQKLKNLYIIP